MHELDLKKKYKSINEWRTELFPIKSRRMLAENRESPVQMALLRANESIAKIKSRKPA